MCTLQSSSNRHSVSLSGLDACHVVNDEMPDVQSPVDTPRQSLSPPLPSMLAGSALTPGRKSMEALKKVLVCVRPSVFVCVYHIVTLIEAINAKPLKDIFRCTDIS